MKINDLFKSRRIITYWLEMFNPLPIRIFHFLTFPNFGFDPWGVRGLEPRGLRRRLVFLVEHVRVLQLEWGAERVPLFWQFVLPAKSSWALIIRDNFFNHSNIDRLKLLRRIFWTVGLIHFNFFQITYALSSPIKFKICWSHGLSDLGHFNIGVKI